MKLVDDSFGKGPVKRPITLPGIRTRIGYDAFHGCGDIVAGPRPCPALVCLGHRYGETIGVNEHLLAIKPKTAGGVERSVRPVGIYLPRLEVRDKDMPVVIGAMLIGIKGKDCCRMRIMLVIEQEKLDHHRMLREHTK